MQSMTITEEYNEETIRIMMTEIQKYYMNKNITISELNFENFLKLSQPYINCVLLETLIDMMDQNIDIDVKRYKDLSYQIKEYCFSNSSVPNYPHLATIH